MFKNKKLGWLILLGFVFGLVVGGLSVHNVSALSNKTYEKLKVFTDCLEIIKKHYVEDVKTEDLISGAIEGMLNSLDPHSAYLDPDMYRELQVETKGSFGGLGIEIAIKDGILTVIAPIEDTPAYRAGIKSGDKILKINEESTKGLNLMECVKRLRGAKGTHVAITIFREGFTQTQEVSMVRDIIKIQSVKYKTLEKGYGYLRISQFQEKTSADATRALEALQKENPEGIKGLILDLRNDPGGLLDQAVGVSDLFLDDGVIVTIKGRNEEEKTAFNAHLEGTMPNWPMVVLVNQGSASASEIVAGALQDYGRAVIMGSKTFGKGSVQTIIPLDDGSGIRLTTARYYTPKGRTIHEKGIEPDIPLPAAEKAPQKMVEEQPAADRDLDRALEQLKGMTILQKYLDKGTK
ncbi:MAG: peptidase S41 [Deltaproteobacteria bacterium RBG_16_54_11]|jgi:carboxyl-terminal processing protease|nr:MAG: peptidase S41 [Deltaproteobacteria bacterium RBG_16_54_11]